MRIATLVDRHRFDLTEGNIADPAPGEVQAKVHSVGICGSDLHNFSEGSVGDMPSQFPMVLGHEPTGTVVKTGLGVTGWSPGDKAMLEPAIYCYHCEHCRSGHHNVCDNLRFLSQPGDPGYFRDFVNIPASCLVPLPDGMDLDYGTLFEPLAVVLHSLKFAAITIGDATAVFGAGPIGLMTVACLKLAGAGRVIAVEPVATRRELARAVGADEVIDPKAVDPRVAVREASGRGGVDVAIDCVTRDGTLDHCLHVTRKCGRVVVTGIPSDPRVTLDYHVMRRNEIHLFNVRRSNHETEAAVALMQARPDVLGPIVTHARPIEQIQGAFEQLESYSGGVGKIVIRME